MRYFVKYSPTKEIGAAKIPFREVEELYASDEPPYFIDDYVEVTFSEYFSLRSCIEIIDGRYLASIMREETYHREPFDNSSLQEKYLKALQKTTSDEV